ncbi:MAG: hypothetical protein LCH85_18335 [Chloroflexi bacterium]|nr:hypothetical protein [Chloroflexota bacterium]
MPVEPWRLQRLNWQVTEYQLDGELAESATNWLSVRDTAELLDQMVKEQHLIVFCYHNQAFAQADGIWFEMFVDYDLVIMLANDAETLFTPLAQQYRKLSTSIIHDNRANQIIWQHDMMFPEEIIQHKRDLLIISHDADSIFLIRQDA